MLKIKKLDLTYTEIVITLSFIISTILILINCLDLTYTEIVITLSFIISTILILINCIDKKNQKKISIMIK